MRESDGGVREMRKMEARGRWRREGDEGVM